MMTRLPRIPILPLLVLAPVVFAPPAPASPVPLEVDVRARAVAPGEPLCIVARSRAPLRSLSASLFDAPVPMIRVPTGDGAGARGETWIGWGVVDLEREPGQVELALRGETVDGREALGTRALTVGSKDFPEQRLKVDNIFVDPPDEARVRIERERKRLAGIYAVRSEILLPLETFVRPVPGRESSAYGTRRFFNGEPSPPHSGLDLRAKKGVPVKAAGRGRVVLADGLYYAGNTVILDHGGGLFTIYAHLSKVLVEEGHETRPGEVVGLVGATGRVTGPHLHWGAKVGDRPFDPGALLDPVLFDRGPGDAALSSGVSDASARDRVRPRGGHAPRRP